MGFQQAATPTPFCAMPALLSSEHKLTMSNSLTSSRTSSPSPRITDGSPPPPDHGWAATQPDRPRRFSEVAISDDGESSILSSQPPSTTASVAPSTPKSDAPRRRVLWTAFDSPPPGPGGGRELERRKTKFKIFVIFRGGWCTSSQALLKGFVELNPSIKQAGGKVVALSSQTAEQVGRAAHDMRLPFQAFGDPSNGLVEEMNIRFKMGCTVNRNAMVQDNYPHGMAEPCVLAVYSDDAQDEASVLFRWSRWQTIASMRHADAWAHITRALASKAEEAEGGPSLSTPTTATPIGLDGFPTPPSSAATAPPPARLPPRQPTPLRPQPRAASPSPSFGGTGGYAPFGGHNEGPGVTSTPRGPGERPGTRGGGRGSMAPTAAAAADGALGVKWMITSRHPAAVSKPQAAARSGGGGGGGRRAVSTPRGGATGSGGQPEAGGDAFFFGGEEAVDHAEGSSGTSSGYYSRPPARPSRYHRPHLLPSYSQAAAVPATPTRQKLPPQHRRPSSDTRADRGVRTGPGGEQHRHHRDAGGVSYGGGGGGGGGNIGRQHQKPEGTPRGTAARRLLLGVTGRARRASFDEAAADFDRGGTAADGGGGGGEEQRRTGSLRFFSSSGGGDGDTAAGRGGKGKKPVVPPSPARPWGYLRKARPPATPKRGGDAPSSPWFRNDISDV